MTRRISRRPEVEDDDRQALSMIDRAESITQSVTLR
jgi:hypothetical protein